MSETKLPPFPPKVDLETVPVLRKLVTADGALRELKGTARSLPNPAILLNTLFLQEALESSEIENIVTTRREAFRAGLQPEEKLSVEAKEVARYRQAMYWGYAEWQKNRFISENMLIGMFQRLLLRRDESYRKVPGTVVSNSVTGEVVHTPPQDGREIITLMRHLAEFINAAPAEGDMSPLIKMALIHHRFESIHPFLDGNGRIGRILNVLYLTHSGRLDMPILYLSRGINRTRSDYYRLLRAVQKEGAWEEWVIYLLNAIAQTAEETIQNVNDICELMERDKERMLAELPKTYSQDLLNSLYAHPYTNLARVSEDLTVGPQTVRRYLKQLVQHRFLTEEKIGRNLYYINMPLFNLLAYPSPRT